MRYAWIDEQRHDFPVAVLCCCLEVSRSGYYEWRGRSVSPRQERHDRLTSAAGESHQASKGVYGYRKVHDDLRELDDETMHCNRETVRHIMRENGWSSRVKRRLRVTTTDSDHCEPVAENLLNRDFSASRPDQKWLTDITYIETGEGWLYLAAVLDLFSRRIVGWAMDDNMQTQLVRRALTMAVKHRLPESDLLHHSDRGSQYASEEYRHLIEINEFTMSMSRKANCWDNAPMESFFGSLKSEWLKFEDTSTREQAKQTAFEYIEVFYNRKRKHQTLDYQTPDAFEQQFYKNLN